MERKSDPSFVVVVDSRCETFSVAAVNKANYISTSILGKNDLITV